MTVRVPAKVNLELLVGPRRDDGYHDLSTVFQAVSLYDDVTVEPADEWGITVTGPYADRVPADGTNLAMRAARTLADAAGVDEPVHIAIHKEIPVAGGMAGGSADARGDAGGLRPPVGPRPRRETVLETWPPSSAATCRSCCPAAPPWAPGAASSSLRCSARGRYHWVFALSDGGLSTPAVYAECDRLRGRPRCPTPSRRHR